MPFNFVQVEGSSHWYDALGVPVYEVPMTTKQGMRPTNVGDAVKLDLLPSITTVERMVAAPGLQAWIINQYILAALTLPRRDEEPLDEFAQRVVQDGRKEGKQAAEFGESIHDLVEKLVMGKPLPEMVTVQQAMTLQSAMGWLSQHTLVPVIAEFGISEPNWGYAGRGDMLAYVDGVLCIIDWKTQKTNPKDTVRFYPEWNMQLSALQKAIKFWAPGDEEIWKLSVVFSSTEPDRAQSFVWLEEDGNDWGWNCFVGALVQFYSPLGPGSKLKKPAKLKAISYD